MDRIFFILTQKLAIGFVFLLPVLGHGLITLTEKHPPQPVADTAYAPGMAIIATNFTTYATTSTDTADASDVNILPNLLPSSSIPFCASTSTCGRKNLLVLIKMSEKMSAKISGSTPTKAVTPEVMKPATISVVASPPQPSSTIPSLTPITAQTLVDAATPTFKKLLNGQYNVVLQAAVDGQTISWDINAPTVLSTGNISFENSYSCDPVPGQPDISDPDQSPIFAVDTLYQCQISLTPTTGTDRRTQSNTISFTTPIGQLVVTPSDAMDTILVNNTNSGGFVLTNQNSVPVTVTGATFNFLYDGVSTDNQPLVFRILDPTTDQSLFDYHLENGAPTSSVAATFSVTIPANTEKMLPVEILGVQEIFVSGTNPTITAQIQNLTTDSNVDTTLAGATISWSCEVPSVGYDPNATSGPFADGRMCGN